MKKFYISILAVAAFSCFNFFCMSNAVAQAVTKARPLQVFSSGGGNMTLQAPAASIANYTLTLPATAPGTGQSLQSDNTGILSWVNAGTVTSFSSGNLSPLFTTSVSTGTTTPSLTYTISNAAAHTFLGNPTGASAAPTYSQVGVDDINATGTPSATTYLRGDGSWATPSGGGGGGTGTSLLIDHNGVTLGKILTMARNTVTIITPNGYITPILLNPTSGTDPFPISQIYWDGTGCTGTPYLNDGTGASSPGGLVSYQKTLCHSGQTGLIYELQGPYTNGTATSVSFTAVDLENPTCGANAGTRGGWKIQSITLVNAGLPSTIAYPLTVQY